jgi:phage-related protein
MNRELIFNGIELSRFCATISGSKSFSGPERDMEFEHVGGRNGDLTIDHGGYLNVETTYHVGIKKPVVQNMNALKRILLPNKGYKRLEDSWSPDEFRLAVYKGPFIPDVKVRLLISELDLTFNCKPQRFLKAGELPVEYETTGSSIYNQYDEAALPLVRVYGTGYLSIGGETIQIREADEYTDIDCELMDAYKGSTNCNGKIQCSSGEFYHLDPGNNGIEWTGDITRVIITPRWWIV